MSIQTLRVHTAPEYTVTIGPGLLKECGPRLREAVPLCHMAVVTDSTVAPLYLETVKTSLQEAGYQVSAYIFPAGEAHKNLDTLSSILEFLAEEHLTRTDCVAALGGGVTGDMAGLAAALLCLAASKFTSAYSRRELQALTASSAPGQIKAQTPG